MPKAKSSVVTIRMDRAQTEAVARLASKHGVTQAVIIRWAIDAFLQYAEAQGGRLHLPVDLSEQWQKIVPPEAQAALAGSPSPDEGG